MPPVIAQSLSLPILLELLHPVATRVVAPGGLLTEADAVVCPAGDWPLARCAGLSLPQQVEVLLAPVGVYLGGPVDGATLRVLARLWQAVARRIHIPALLLPTFLHGPQAACRVVAIAQRVLRGLHGRELAQRVVVVLALAELAHQHLGHLRLSLQALAVQCLQAPQRFPASADGQGLPPLPLQRAPRLPVQAVALEVDEGAAVVLKAMHMARAVQQPLNGAHALQLAGLAVAQRIELMGNGVLELDLGLAALADAVQPLGLTGDATEHVTLDLDAALGLFAGFFEQVHAGGHQPPSRVPLVAVNLRRRRFGGRQLSLGQTPSVVPAVMGAALCGGVAVPGFAELASRIPAVVLQAPVEPFFLHQPVHHVPGKAALRAVLVEQAAQTSGCVVFELQRQTAVDSADQAAPQVVGQIDGVLAADPFSRLDMAELALGVVRITLDLAIGQPGGADAALAITLMHGALAERVDDFQQLAKAVVAVLGDLARAVGIGHQQAGIAPAQALHAALGVFDLAGAVADERCFLRAGVAVALSAAIGLAHFDQPALRVMAVVRDGAHRVGALPQASAGLIVLAAAPDAARQLHAGDAALAITG